MSREDDEHRLLAFAANYRYVVRDQAQALLGLPAAEATGLLDRLSATGELRSSRQPGGETWYLITRRGLRTAGSELSAPKEKESSARHDAGVAWLHLAAGAGAFGGLSAIVSERAMRSRDRREDRGPERYGVRRGGPGRFGEERLHYPDLLLIDRGGRRIAVELELSTKSRGAREQIFSAYAAARNVDVVLYLVETPAMAAVIRRHARKYGMSDRVHVQYVARSGSPREKRGGRAPARVPPSARTAAREAER